MKTIIHEGVEYMTREQAQKTCLTITELILAKNTLAEEVRHLCIELEAEISVSSKMRDMLARADSELEELRDILIKTQTENERLIERNSELTDGMCQWSADAAQVKILEVERDELKTRTMKALATLELISQMDLGQIGRLACATLQDKP